MIPQGGQEVAYGYDTLGRLQNIASGPNTFTYGYTGINPLIQNLTRPNGSRTEYLYNDPLKSLTDVINKKSDNQIINSFTYTYNSHDLRGSENSINGTPIISFVEGLKTYNYNNVNQLLSSANPNQLFEYDADGDMTNGYTPEGYVLTMTYDGEKRLKTMEHTDSSSIVHRTEYYYSGDNLLAEVKKYQNSSLTADSRYLRVDLLPLQERDANNNVVREFTWGIDKGGGIEGLLNLKQSGMDYSYLYDGKGNVAAVIDATQNVVATYAYSPFGKLMNKTGTLNQPYMFSTKEYDPETGLSYYGYRFYSPSIGRWISRDPIEEKGGLNLYGFVGNNSLNNIDPTGLKVELCYSPLEGIFGKAGAKHVTVSAKCGKWGFHPKKDTIPNFFWGPGAVRDDSNREGMNCMDTGMTNTKCVDEDCVCRRIGETAAAPPYYGWAIYNCHSWARQILMDCQKR